MLLTLRSNPAEDYAFRSKRPAVRGTELRQRLTQTHASCHVHVLKPLRDLCMSSVAR